MTKKFVVFSILLGVLCVSLAEGAASTRSLSLSKPGVTQTDAEQEKAVIAASNDWLALIDGGKYNESWEKAAEIFKLAVPKDQWSARLEAQRTPMGRNTSRKKKSVEFTDSLPNAPQGRYAIVLNDVSFENFKYGVEKLVLMLEKDGKWRVVGYFMI